MLDFQENAECLDRPDLVTGGDVGRMWLWYRRHKHSFKSMRSRWVHHLSLMLEPVLLSSFKQAHAWEIVERVKRIPVSPRYRKRMIEDLKSMFEESKLRGLIPENPFKGIPARGLDIDADLEWRDGAWFETEEVEQILTDLRIPLYRRVRYALLATTGMRISELAALVFRMINGHYIGIVRAFNTPADAVLTPKVPIARRAVLLPVARQLVSLLRDGGYREAFGRDPGPDDLVCPSIDRWTKGPRHLRNEMALDNFKDDLATLGLRKRTIHDFRRTFQTLALEGSMEKDVSTQITHVRPRDVNGRYRLVSPKTLLREAQKHPLWKVAV